MEVSCIGVNF